MSSNDLLRDYEVRFLPRARLYAPEEPCTIPYRPTIGAPFDDFGCPPPQAELFVSDVTGRVVWVDIRDL